MKKQVSSKIVALVFGIIVICFAIAFYAFSWTGPTAPPPEGNVDPPINVGGTEQYKSGGLGIGGVFHAYSNAIIDGNVGIGTIPSQKLDVAGYVRGQTGLCIGNDCRTSWPSGGGGITSLSAGSGITLTPNPITSTGTISANTTYLQRRVTGTCASNQAIRVINSDGTITCVNLPPSALCTFGSKTFSTGFRCCTGTRIYQQCEANGTWSTDTNVICVEQYGWCTSY